MNKESAKGSATAWGVATLRAAHLLVDGNPKLLDDDVTLKLLESGEIDLIKSEAGVYLKPGSMKLRAHVLLRGCYTEDCLQQAFDKGIRQYLILGAGYDTFAYRQKTWSADLNIFEVDHPATQAGKIARLKQAGIKLPANLTFVPVDFESTNLTNELRKSKFDFNKPVFISWLGVTMYLTMEAIDDVFAFAASLPQPTEMVFTFAQQKPFNKPWSLARKAAEMGEPWLSYFTLDDLDKRLKSHGFKEVSFLAPDEARQTYFAGRTDGLASTNNVGIGRAVV